MSISIKAQEPRCVWGMGSGGGGQAVDWCVELVLPTKSFEMRTLIYLGGCIATSLCKRKYLDAVGASQSRAHRDSMTLS